MSKEINIEKGRKRSRDEKAWRTNIAQKARNEGKSYESRSGEVIEEKTFEEVTSCCKKECFKKIEVTEQRRVHDKFWGFGDYQCQNVFLSMILEASTPLTTIGNLQKKSPQQWNYAFPTESGTINVCKQFLTGVLNVSEGRIKTVQTKIINGKPLADGRGNHGNHHILLTDELKKLIHMHCESLSHSESHYTRENTKLMYFHDSSITLTRLYQMFLDYYAAVTQTKVIPICESAYAKYFNHHVNFTFSLPRSDVCNLCYEYEHLCKRGDLYENHRKSIESYNTMKEKMMKQKDGVLHSVFDFAQNLPLPKLPVNCQFYCRLLWLQIFNVHIFDSDESYMFYFIEGTLKKGANTVCNLLYHALQFELQKQCCNKICLYSDAAGSQNRNYLMVLVLSMLSKKFDIFIEHLYPVRGHSYCECDRNFGRYGREKKSREVIETPEEYVDLIKHSRDPPFTMIDAQQCGVKDFEPVLEKNKEILKMIKISSVVKIDYFPNDEINIYYQYQGVPSNIRLRLNISFDELENAASATGVGISNEKIKDLKRLQPFLSLKGKLFYENLFKTTLIRAPKTKNVETEKKNIIDNQKEKTTKTERKPAVEKKKKVTAKGKMTKREEKSVVEKKKKDTAKEKMTKSEVKSVVEEQKKDTAKGKMTKSEVKSVVKEKKKDTAKGKMTKSEEKSVVEKKTKDTVKEKISKSEEKPVVTKKKQVTTKKK